MDLLIVTARVHQPQDPCSDKGIVAAVRDRLGHFPGVEHLRVTVEDDTVRAAVFICSDKDAIRASLQTELDQITGRKVSANNLPKPV